MGDGPGVGKGRQIAGIIMENYLRGMWVQREQQFSVQARCRAVSDVLEIL